MKSLRCKCGKRVAWTSDSFPDCHGCPDCKTTYADQPDQHKEIQPHTWEIKYNQNTGKPYKRCKLCQTPDLESYNEAKKE